MPPLPFHPLVNAWFEETFKKPTPVQEEAWPLIARGENVLALAPTGSGKTLTAFLAAISRFAEGTYDAVQLSVLYVSPLKALNEDIKRNLLVPLEEIKARFEKAGEVFPAIRVDTRSGDTPQSERRRFLSFPPSILALTPESLGIILLNPRGRQVLSTVRYVIMDEIHAALGTKRGCYLSCQIDRLSLLAGEFQRVALSATVKPPEAAADFAGGLRKSAPGKADGKAGGRADSPAYEKRPVRIIAPEQKKEIEFKVIYRPPGEVAGRTAGKNAGQPYPELIGFIIERIKANSGPILVFTDSRRRTERISYFLNRESANDSAFAGRTISYAHHGSLSKEVRREVEKALTSGEISCVVATGSLELGIDIGSVEEVILAGSPSSAASALQRIGRSGHRVGEASRGWLLPFHGLDLLQAAAVAGAISSSSTKNGEERELEETTCIENPLDILSQIVLALVDERDWNEDELFQIILGFYIYRNLSRASYNGVVRMLAGAYEGTRLRELKRQIFRDDETGVLSAAPGARLLLYTSGGVITSRGSYSMRIAADESGSKGTKIGELDEEFVWERRIGDRFDFGNRTWRITKIGDEAVEVIPLSTGADSVPFWHAEAVYRSPVITRRILEVLDGYYPKGWTSLKAEKMLLNFSDEAKTALEEFLHSQWSFQTGSSSAFSLPSPSFIPVEIIDNLEERGDAFLVILHSFRGGGVNYPLSLALAQDMEARFGFRVEGAADDNCVFLRLPRSIPASPALIIEESLRRLSSIEGKGEERFRERLESSGVFGAAFRESAERSLVLPRSPYGKRMPLWVMRQKSRQLFDAVMRYRDFPVSAEAWRICLKDQFDMAGFNSLLDAIGSGEVSFDFFTTREPSPFSKGMTWAETNVLMYQYDERPELLAPGQHSVSDLVIAEALGNAAARPPLKAQLIEDFCSRLRREIPGWAPEEAVTLCEWVKERVAIPDDEWEILLKCIPPELLKELENDKTLGGKLEYVKRNDTVLVVHREWAKKLKEAGSADFASFLFQWLRYEGPVSPERLNQLFGPEAGAAIDFLSGQGALVNDVVVEDKGSFLSGLYCDRENLQMLLRLGRRKQRPEVKERPASLLVPYLALRQGLLPGYGHSEESPWKHLSGITAAAKLWETEFFPCRCNDAYSAEKLDSEIRQGRLVWYGAGKEKAGFCRPEDLELVLPHTKTKAGLKLPAGFFDTPRSFWEIKDALAATADLTTAAHGVPDHGADDLKAAAAAIWEEVWRGSISADSWEPLRKAIETGFAPALPAADEAAGGRRPFRVPRAVRERWRSGPPVRGVWFSLAGDEEDLSPADLGAADYSALEEEELARERVRLLLDRWGVLSRPLLEREVPSLSWARLLPAMRRLELAGELVAGRFFGGINSLQFASPRIVGELEEAEAARGIYWMNAADPASPAGLDIEGIFGTAEKTGGQKFRRVPQTRFCYRGTELAAVSYKGGRELEIFIPPDDKDIAEVLSFIKAPRTRKVHPENKIIVEKIHQHIHEHETGSAAARSDYSPVLASLGFVKDRGKMILW